MDENLIHNPDFSLQSNWIRHPLIIMMDGPNPIIKSISLSIAMEHNMAGFGLLTFGEIRMF